MDRLEQACTQQRSVEVVQKVLMDMVANGFAADQVMRQWHERLVKDTGLTSKQKSLVMVKLCQMEKMLVDGGDECLNLLDMALEVQRLVVGH